MAEGENQQCEREITSFLHTATEAEKDRAPDPGEEKNAEKAVLL